MEKQAIKFKLSVSIIKEGSRYVAYAPALDLSSSGKTAAHAKKRFIEAAGIFFEEISKKGTFGIVLRNLGWKRVNSIWSPPKIVASETELFCVTA